MTVTDVLQDLKLLLPYVLTGGLLLVILIRIKNRNEKR